MEIQKLSNIRYFQNPEVKIRMLRGGGHSYSQTSCITSSSASTTRKSFSDVYLSGTHHGSPPRSLWRNLKTTLQKSNSEFPRPRKAAETKEYVKNLLSQGRLPLELKSHKVSENLRVAPKFPKTELLKGRQQLQNDRPRTAEAAKRLVDKYMNSKEYQMPKRTEDYVRQLELRNEFFRCLVRGNDRPFSGAEKKHFRTKLNSTLSLSMRADPGTYEADLINSNGIELKPRRMFKGKSDSNVILM